MSTTKQRSAAAYLAVRMKEANFMLKLTGFDMRQQHIHQQMNVPTLRFSKTGAEIKKAIETRIELTKKIRDASKAVMEEICKRREIDLDTVLDDTEVHTARGVMPLYESRMSEAIDENSPKSFIDRLQEDLSTLKGHRSLVQAATIEIYDLHRIRSHLEDDRKFDLPYGELVELGFTAPDPDPEK